MQDIAQILDHDGSARFTQNNYDLKMIYPDFGNHPDEQFIFGIEQPEGMNFYEPFYYTAVFVFRFYFTSSVNDTEILFLNEQKFFLMKKLSFYYCRFFFQQYVRYR